MNKQTNERNKVWTPEIPPNGLNGYNDKVHSSTDDVNSLEAL